VGDHSCGAERRSAQSYTEPLTETATEFVTREGARLFVGDDPFRIEGCNTYYLMVYATDESMRARVDEVLDAAADAGLNTLRTWAFNDGSDEWNALQPAPGVFDEQVLRGLDYVVEQAGRRGLRLILPLVNYWPDYGGMDQYVAWSPHADNRDDFYRDDWCRRAYRRQIRTVVNRHNHRNGVPYCEDPTILAWELANEPRCPSDPSGRTLQNWIEEMSGFVRSLDDDHLIAIGLEGFFGRWTGRPNPPRWPDGQGTGFVWNHEPHTVDLATFHLYPDHWWMHPGEGIPWIRRHIAAARQLGKPVLLEEYGKRGGPSVRGRCFQSWRNALEIPDGTPNPVSGSMFWALYHHEYPDYDGFGIYPDDELVGAVD